MIYIFKMMTARLSKTPARMCVDPINTWPFFDRKMMLWPLVQGPPTTYTSRCVDSLRHGEMTISSFQRSPGGGDVGRTSEVNVDTPKSRLCIWSIIRTHGIDVRIFIIIYLYIYICNCTYLWSFRSGMGTYTYYVYKLCIIYINHIFLGWCVRMTDIMTSHRDIRISRLVNRGSVKPTFCHEIRQQTWAAPVEIEIVPTVDGWNLAPPGMYETL